MAELAAPPVEPIALRILRTLEAVLDRHVAGTEGERQAALVAALRDELAHVPEAARAATVQALRVLLPADDAGMRAGPSAAAAARIAELEDEVARLDECLRSVPPAPAPRPAGDTTERLARLLGIQPRALEGADAAVVEAQVVETVKLLVDFGLGLLRAYIPVTQDEDRTVAGLVQRLVSDAVTGRGDPEALAGHVERTHRQIGKQVLAFRRACEEGARAVLRGLAPDVIEAEAARNASYLEKKFGTATQCWETYQKRFGEIRAATDLYQTHFDGPLRREMHRLAQTGDAKRVE